MNEKKTLTRTLIEADVPRPNGRVYPLAVLQKAVEAVLPKVAERRLLGTLADGPERLVLADVTHMVTELRWDGPKLVATVEFLDTPKGKELWRLLEAIYDDHMTYMAHAGLELEANGTVSPDGKTVETMEIRSIAVRCPRHITTVREENEELNALMDRQHERVRAATQLWREETKQFLTQPDLGNLVDWLLNRAANAQTLNADLLAQLSDVQKAALEAMRQYPPGSEGSKAFSAVFARADTTSRSPSALWAENQKLLAAIREHAFEKGDDRCWIDDEKLYAAAGIDLAETNTALPPKDEFLGNCARYHACRQKPGAVYVTPAEHLKRVGRAMYNLGARQALKESEVEAELEKTIARVKETP